MFKNTLIPPTTNQKLFLVLSAFAFMFFWLAVIELGLKYITKLDFFGNEEFSKIGDFVFACILAPLWEELAFRFAPIQIAKKLNKALDKNFTIPVVIISSAIFGWGHGHGTVSLLIQGVLGILLCYVYIRNNYSYWSAVLLHFLWNVSVLYIFHLNFIN